MKQKDEAVQQEKRLRKYGKKNAVKQYNEAKDISDFIMPIGQDTCGGTLFLYLKSNDENVFRIYCDNPNCKNEYDVRTPKDGPIFWVKPDMQKQTLIENYGEDKINSLWENKPTEVKDSDVATYQ
jgi:hypothetical protein